MNACVCMHVCVYVCVRVHALIKSLQIQLTKNNARVKYLQAGVDVACIVTANNAKVHMKAEIKWKTTHV